MGNFPFIYDLLRSSLPICSLGPFFTLVYLEFFNLYMDSVEGTGVAFFSERSNTFPYSITNLFFPRGRGVNSHGLLHIELRGHSCKVTPFHLITTTTRQVHRF